MRSPLVAAQKSREISPLFPYLRGLKPYLFDTTNGIRKLRIISLLPRGLKPYLFNPTTGAKPYYLTQYRSLFVFYNLIDFWSNFFILPPPMPLPSNHQTLQTLQTCTLLQFILSILFFPTPSSTTTFSGGTNKTAGSAKILLSIRIEEA